VRVLRWPYPNRQSLDSLPVAVSLPGRLATKMADNLADVHPQLFFSPADERQIGIVKLLSWSFAARIDRRGDSGDVQGYRYPIEVIGHAVWLYHRFALSLRDVEELMLARGVVVSYETIRSWCAKFGPDYADQLRRRRPRPGTNGTSTRCSFGSAADSIICGVRSISTVRCSTSWFSPAETPRRPGDSSASYSRACGTFRGCWSPTSWPATRSPTARRWPPRSTAGRSI
jgi:hypothetical protein